MITPLTEIERINVLLPTELFAGSKDWRVGSVADRVEWLLTMYSSAKEEVERLQSALEAQPQQEPVAWVRWEWNRSGLKSLVFKKPEELSLAETATGVVYDPLYTSPPAQRKPLTDEEMYLAIRPLFRTDAFADAALELSKDEYQAIEAAHGIKGDA